ncbi:hypothetical protein [Bermanella sp. R86510]|uniref:hypothetical protein n=1 Tax=unclassified Bermanella TaxID=2627862 RepID=UPI0037C73406
MKNFVFSMTVLLVTVFSSYGYAAVERTPHFITLKSNEIKAFAALPKTKEIKAESNEIESEDFTTNKEVLFRIVGGMRLRIAVEEGILSADEKQYLDRVTWQMDTEGRQCDNFEYQDNNTNCETLAADTETDAELETHVIYNPPRKEYYMHWEPKEWDNDVDVQGTLTITFTSPLVPERKIPFRIESREIKAETVALEGSDIAMLEQMLWQMGISPQKGTGYQDNSNAGSQGNRIHSRRANKAKSMTENCDGTDATRRDIYTKDWSTCSAGKVALEGMIRRFKGRHISSKDTSDKFSRNGGATVNGDLNTAALAQLKYIWEQYKTAVDSNPKELITLSTPEMDQWLDEAVAIWENGLTDKTTLVPASYTSEAHKKVLSQAGVSGDTYSRKALLKAWKARETSSHWGEGYPATSYRITEGGGDELGSMSYNQVWFAYRYSEKPLLVHKEAGLNYYDPLENLKGFIVHTSGHKPAGTGGFGHTGAFYDLFDENTQGRSNNINTLKGYQSCSSSGTCSEFKAKSANEDEYEKLARAIAAYNTNPGSGSWPSILKNKTPCKNCSVEYTIAVRNQRFGLPYRAYIWKGGEYPANLTDTNGNPDPKAGTEWCFKYGEEEWIDPAVHPLTKKQLDWQGYKDLASSDLSRRVPCE